MGLSQSISGSGNVFGSGLYQGWPSYNEPTSLSQRAPGSMNVSELNSCQSLQGYNKPESPQ